MNRMKIHFWLRSWNKTMCGRDVNFNTYLKGSETVNEITCKSCKNKADRLILHPVTEQEKTTIACMGGFDIKKHERVLNLPLKLPEVNMIEIREVKPDNPYSEGLIAIDKKTSIDFYTRTEAIEIKRRLIELFPDA